MTYLRGNVGEGPTITVELAAEFEAFDRLPRELRALIQAAPAKFSALDINGYWRTAQLQRQTPEQFARTVVEAIARQMGRECRAIYGPSHPQAGA